MKKQLTRVLHITLRKCGSQWVRDVLSAPEIAAISGYPHSKIMPEFGNFNHLAIIPDHTFTGPIYGMNRWEWQCFKRHGDKAVVILRDPRDAQISWMFSMLYSHGSSARIDVARRLLHALPNEQTRIRYVVYQSGGTGTHWMYRTWCEGRDPDALVMRYENLVANQHEEFKMIVDWLGWNIPKETLEMVVNRLSFEARSGHKVGESDKFSHYRRGVAGDWRNYFTRELGELWEQMYPGFLCDIGYEESNDWWHSLPDRQTSNENASEALQSTSEENLVTALEKKLRQVQQELVEKERFIQELLRVQHTSQSPSNAKPSLAGLIAGWLCKLKN